MKPQWFLSISSKYVFPRSISKLKRDHRREINKEMAARGFFLLHPSRLTSDPAANEIRARPPRCCWRAFPCRASLARPFTMKRKMATS